MEWNHLFAFIILVLLKHGIVPVIRARFSHDYLSDVTYSYDVSAALYVTSHLASITGTIVSSRMKIICTGRGDNHIGSMTVRRMDGYNPLLSCITMAAKWSRDLAMDTQRL